MHVLRCLVAALTSGACQTTSPDGSGSDDEPAPGSKPAAGGSTADFGGDCVCDRITRDLALSEVDEVTAPI